MSTKTILNILAVIIVIGLIFFGYRLIFKPAADPVASDSVGLVPAGFADEGSPTGTDEFLQILLSLQKLDLSSGVAFFTNSVFQSLRDFTTELQMKTPGKQNPFAPTLGPARPGVFDPNRTASGATPARQTTGPRPNTTSPSGATSPRSQLGGTGTN